jgi:predicted nucleic acid-binding protein
MVGRQIVIDTNVLVAAFRSRRGASHRLLSLVDAGSFEINVSVPLVLEYEDALSRPEFGFSPDEVRDVVDYLCAVANRHHVFFLWRPYLNDPKDDMVLELAVTAGCSDIVTFNQRDFQGTERFGVYAVRPVEFLRILGEVP